MSDDAAIRPAATITVSVVIATLNRPALLDRCLDALARQTLPMEQFEIIVVDDGPHAATEGVVREWLRRRPGSHGLYSVAGPAHGPAAARNVGWRTARGAVIAFTDDDCIPDAGWLAAGLRALTTHDAGAVWGRIIVPLTADPTDWERNVAGLQEAPCATANCFYRRWVLEAVGGFDERFTEAWREDSDLQFKVMARGVAIRHQPSAIVEHPARPAPWGISIKLQRQNRFNALLYKKHPRLYQVFNPHEPPWAYYAMVLLMCIGGVAMFSGNTALATVAMIAWAFLVGNFCFRRLRRASRRPLHIAEMLVTSLIIPPYAVFWRLYGALKYRVAFF